LPAGFADIPFSNYSFRGFSIRSSGKLNSFGSNLYLCMEKGLVFDIRHFSVHDGPGIRTTVFLKGCPLRCTWCHNPESQKSEPETIQRTNKLDGNEYAATETIGRYMTVDEVFDELKNHIPIFDESTGGVTFSGGEPLMQPHFVLQLLKRCHANEIHTAIDTCGFASQETISLVLPYTNLFLFDLKLISPAKHEMFTGQTNHVILKNLFYLEQNNANVLVRIPLIPGITDDEANLAAIKAIIKPLGCVKRIDLLPYHHLAKDKYRRMNIPYGLEHIEPYTDERLAEIKSIFNDLEIPVSIGG